MNFNSITIALLVLLTISSCERVNKETIKKAEIKTTVSKGDSIINLAIKKHGGALFKSASYSFIFRNNTYEFINNNTNFTYKSTKVNTANDTVIDVLTNSGFERSVNGKKIDLKKEDASRFGESLNSVIYFATLPYKLNDKAVFKTFKGETTINKEPYFVVKVTFSENGGGKDHEDQYYYWIHKKNHTMDYLAYNYKVNNGGVRFRSSYNRRNVSGILFQDYVNYKAEVGTPLSELPKLYENNQLKEVSRIETEEVQLISQ